MYITCTHKKSKPRLHLAVCARCRRHKNCRTYQAAQAERQAVIKESLTTESTWLWPTPGRVEYFNQEMGW